MLLPNDRHLYPSRTQDNGFAIKLMMLEAVGDLYTLVDSNDFNGFGNVTALIGAMMYSLLKESASRIPRYQDFKGCKSKCWGSA